MEQSITPYIQILTWKKVKDLVQKQEPELAEIIDKINPDDSFHIYKISYRYGDFVYQKGTFFIPNSQQKLVPLNDSSVPKEIQQALSYSPLPLGITINNRGVEIFNELDDRVFSMAYFNQGLNLGIWEMFAPVIPLTVTAGARSLQMLPRISEANSHKKLKRFGIQSPPPKTPLDQWAIFKEAAQHPEFSEPWQCDILFFSNKWAEEAKAANQPGSAWLLLQKFLLERAWRHTTYIRNKMHLEMLWETFSRFLNSKKIKPQPYLVETLKHLVFIALGVLPGFRPAVNNEAAPIDGIIRMYIESYGLKYYAPSLMQPDYFSLSSQDENNYIYYSLQVPTYQESIPKTRTPVSARADLTELIHLINHFTVELRENKTIQYSAHHFYNLLIQIKFDYFHDDAEPHIGIRPSEEMGIEDPKLLYLPSNLSDNEPRKFCDRGTFVRGCIRISSNKN